MISEGTDSMRLKPESARMSVLLEMLAVNFLTEICFPDKNVFLIDIITDFIRRFSIFGSNKNKDTKSTSFGGHFSVCAPIEGSQPLPEILCAPIEGSQVWIFG